MPNLRNKYWKPVSAVVLWGASFIATKIALSDLTPQAIIVLRLILAIVLLSGIAVYRKSKFRYSVKNHLYILLLAVIAVIHLWIQVTGLKYTSASNTGWIIGTTPVFMSIIGFIFFGEKVNTGKLAGIVLAFLGLLLLISNGNLSQIGLISNKGDFLVLASAFTWSVYSAVNKKISLNYSPFYTVLSLFIMMLLIIAPFTVNTQMMESVAVMSYKSWISILFLGIFCSGIAYVLWAEALGEMESAKVGSFLYFEPFVTVFTAWALLNESLTIVIILSGLIITAGVLMVNRN